MAGVAYREQVLSCGNTDNILLDYSDGSPQIDPLSLNWHRVFYLESSLLVCKAKTNELQVQQHFLKAKEDMGSYLDPKEIEGLESSNTITFKLPSRIIPDIGLFCDPNQYTIYTATADGKIYLFEFMQEMPFAKGYSRAYLGVKGYDLEFSVSSFCLYRAGSQHVEVAVGTSSGFLKFVILPQPQENQFTLPIAVTEIGPPTNLIKSFTQLLIKQKEAETIERLFYVKSNRIVAFSRLGFLRLYDTQKPGLLSEINLGTGILQDFKFAAYSTEDLKYVAVGFVDITWHISIFRIANNLIAFVSDFALENSKELLDLGLNESGVWCAYETEKGKRGIQMWNYVGEAQEVYSWDSDMMKEHLEDQILIENSQQVQETLIDRIVIPGRFSKHLLEKAIAQFKGLEEFSFGEECIGDEILELCENPEEDLASILEFLKAEQYDTSGIQGLCFCQEEGRFLPLVVRGSSYGVLRPVANQIESCSLKSTLISNEFPVKSTKFVMREVNLLKTKLPDKGLPKALAVSRIWRSRFQWIFEDIYSYSFSEKVKLVSKQPLPYSFRKLILRCLPRNLPQAFFQEIYNLQELCRAPEDTDLPSAISYWPPFVCCLLGGSVKSLIKAVNDYSLDLLALSALCVTSLRSSLSRIPNDTLLNDTSNIAYSFLAISSTLNFTVLPSSVPKLYNKHSLHSYEHPVSVATLYSLEKAEPLLGPLEEFCPSQLSSILTAAQRTALRNLTFKFPFVSNSFVPNLLKTLVKLNQSSAATYFLSYLECTNAGCLFMSAKNYLNNEELSKASAEFLGVDCLIEDYENMTKFPWMSEASVLDHIEMPVINYHDNIVRHYNYPELISKVVSGSLNAFNAGSEDEEFLLHCIGQLITAEDYKQAFIVMLKLKTQDFKKRCIALMTEKACESFKLFELLELPLTPSFKGHLFDYLKEQCLSQSFNLPEVLASPQFKNSNVFTQQVSLQNRSNYTQKKIPTHKAFYAFCIKNFYYSSAAEAMYKHYLEIQYFLESANYTVEEISVLQQLQKEALLLCLTAARNISDQKKSCWFIVNSSSQFSPFKRKLRSSPQSTKKPPNALVTIQDVESKLNNLLT